jgi:hypothetical protein
MYTYAHPIEDALENITHSICTLEFEDQRPFYDWLLGNARRTRPAVNTPLPQQIEFARLNLSYVVLSKRKLIQLVEEKHVDGWDDPRLPTLVGARRRGYTPEGFRRFADRIGVTKSDSWIDISVLEDASASDLNETAPRRIAVLDPLKLVIDNYPEGQFEECLAPNHPQQPEWGKRPCPSRRNSGSSARTSWKCLPRATSASSPATRCACATASSSNAPAATRTPTARSSPCIASTMPTRSPARRAPTTTRSRATSTGSRAGTPVPPKCGSTTACSPSRRRARATVDFIADLNPNSKRGRHRATRSRR